MNDKILSQSDLVEITGYKQTRNQIKVLRKRGVEPIHRPDNTLCVLWKWIENLNTGDSKIEAPRPKLRFTK